MARITREEGLRIAERAAWADHGTEHKFWFTYGQRLAPWAALAGAGAAIAFGIHWAWGKATAVELPDSGGVPWIAWVALVALVLVTLLAVSSANWARSAGTMLGLWTLVALGWLGAGAYAVGFMI